MKLRLKYIFFTIMTWIDDYLMHPVWNRMLDGSRTDDWFGNIAFPFCQWAQGNYVLIHEKLFPEEYTPSGIYIPKDDEIEWDGIDAYGHLMTKKQFIDECDKGYFLDYDGIGYLSDGEFQTHIPVRPSTIGDWEDDDRFTHVVWFNR